MKKIVLVLVLCILLIGYLSASADELHLLWDIPFGTNILEFIDRASEEQGVTFRCNSRKKECTSVDLNGKQIMGFPVEEITVLTSYDTIDWTKDLPTEGYGPENQNYYTAFVDFMEVPLSPEGSAEDRFGELIDGLSIIYGEMVEAYGQPTAMYYDLINFISDYDNHNLFSPTMDEEFVIIEDFKRQVTPEECAKLAPQYDNVGVKICFYNVLLNGWIDSDLSLSLLYQNEPF